MPLEFNTKYSLFAETVMDPEHLAAILLLAPDLIDDEDILMLTLAD